MEGIGMIQPKMSYEEQKETIVVIPNLNSSIPDNTKFITFADAGKLTKEDILSCEKPPEEMRVIVRDLISYVYKLESINWEKSAISVYDSSTLIDMSPPKPWEEFYSENFKNWYFAKKIPEIKKELPIDKIMTEAHAEKSNESSMILDSIQAFLKKYKSTFQKEHRLKWFGILTRRKADIDAISNFVYRAFLYTPVYRLKKRYSFALWLSEVLYQYSQYVRKPLEYYYESLLNREIFSSFEKTVPSPFDKEMFEKENLEILSKMYLQYKQKYNEYLSRLPPKPLKEYIEENYHLWLLETLKQDSIQSKKEFLNSFETELTKNYKEQLKLFISITEKRKLGEQTESMILATEIEETIFLTAANTSLYLFMASKIAVLSPTTILGRYLKFFRTLIVHRLFESPQAVIDNLLSPIVYQPELEFNKKKISDADFEMTSHVVKETINSMQEFIIHATIEQLDPYSSRAHKVKIRPDAGLYFSKFLLDMDNVFSELCNTTISEINLEKLRKCAEIDFQTTTFPFESALLAIFQRFN